MFKIYTTVFGIFITVLSVAQTKPELTVQHIMRDPKTWIGTSPSNPYWSEDSKTIYFRWNPEVNPDDSLYQVSISGGQPNLVKSIELNTLTSPSGVYSKDRTKKLFTRNGDIFIIETGSGKISQLTNTLTWESSPAFTRIPSRITFTAEGNLFLLDTRNGQLTQLTDFKSGSEKKEKKKSEQDEWLSNDELTTMQVLHDRKQKADQIKKITDQRKPKRPVSFYLEGRTVSNLQLSPDEKFITFILRKNPDDPKSTIVPNYVTESSYTESISTRPKVGSPQADQQLGIYNIVRDSIYMLRVDQLPGITNQPDYKRDYPSKKSEVNKPKAREAIAFNPVWSEDGKYAVLNVRSKDNKDRWIALLDVATENLYSLDHQHDEAWIGGPGINAGDLGWMPDQKRVWFQSEVSGYSHLYTVDVATNEKRALTSGKFEVYNPRISTDKKFWYFEANINHPGDRQLYYLPLEGGAPTKITTLSGGNNTYLSPDEKKIAVLHSSSNQPWELYVMDNPVTTKKSSTRQLTQSQRQEFKSYPWRKPEVITFPARDGEQVYARLYKPEGKATSGPAVIFVHGAGYLQNAHLWWSSYFREYMFHNLLVDKGYTVLDIDYRGSAGYGRNWRTGIYRHMGGKDLSDHVDGAKFLVESLGVDPKKIGLYGGSYGGFMTLMAMFTEPDVFAAGAALRSVTDWAHYNHPYTANILNTPVEDSIAYRKSSPLYFAEGLKGHLLICHGMIDTNVHFQDVVRLTQRLIELKKENWELAVYPLEDHGFVEPSSWTDEYRRILKLFEDTLKN
ncbi:MAG: S9 family peptidase [Cyclobacteriaceae bacterium]|nr:S9 family peptidase [Cyclobacteriaceae bacterium]